MTTGLSGTYAIGGTDLTLQPSQGGYLEKDIVGIDGNAHAIYATPRSFELNWQLISVGDYQQIVNAYNSVSNTGSVAVDIPEWGAPEYRFARYSGVILQEPTFSNYFNGYIENAKLLLVNIITG